VHVIGRALSRLRREEDGVALVLALATMSVLALTTTALLLNGTVNQRGSYTSLQAKQAFAVAQEALAYDEGMVYDAGVTGVAPPTTLQHLPTQPDGSTGTYYASTSDNRTWHLVASGTSGGVTRTVGADATPPSSKTVQGTGVWNYLYTDSTSSCLNISGGVTVSVPILTRGNVCISGGGHVVNPSSGSPITLEVGGTLSDTGGSNVGSSSQKLSKVQIGGCTAWNSAGGCSTTTTSSCTLQPSTIVTVTPGTSYCDGNHSPLYASQVGGTLDVTPQMPCIGQSSTLNPNCPSSTASWSTLSSLYTTEKAATKTGCPSNLLDDSGWTLNNSLSASTLTNAMFPSNSSYDCKIVSNGTTIGEIAWNAVGKWCSSGTLTVSGTLYFDGSLDLGCGWKVQYSGQATLYFTGTVTQEGGTQLCGIASCTGSWDPDVNGIIFIAGCWANSTGSSLASSRCVDVTGGATAQWGAYATTAYQIDGGSTNMGPVLANTMVVGGGSSTLIPFHQFPPGTPLSVDTVELPGTPPTNWSG
jgi:Tfp pilus assembly protein PilX